MELSTSGLEITVSLVDIRETDEGWEAVVNIKKTLVYGGFAAGPPTATIEVLKLNEEVVI